MNYNTAIKSVSNHIKFFMDVAKKREENNINLRKIPNDFLMLLVAIERSINACESFPHLLNVKRTWLKRLDREYGNTRNKHMQDMISDTWAIWADKEREIKRAYLRKLSLGYRFANALNLSLTN